MISGLDGAGLLAQPSRSMRLLLLLVLLVAPAARAHDADIVFAQITREEGGAIRERLTMTAATLSLLAPIGVGDDGRIDDAELEAGRAAIEAGVWAQVPLRGGDAPCRRRDTRARVQQTYVALEGTFDCPDGELSQVFRILSVLPSAYKVVLGTYGQGGALQNASFAQGNQQTLILSAPSAGAKPGSPSFVGWFGLGIRHIFGGIDHLAFLLALLMVGGHWKRVLLLVTSFTVAHSITLGATALGWVRLGPSMQSWVEVAIAGSIVWVAVENLVLRTHRHRAWLTFAFGLVHGFGFASVLLELGLGDDAAGALAGFNLGVEAGQAVVVFAAYPLVRLLARHPVVNLWTLRVGSGAILAAGAFWMATRLG